jgi:hypothetical protein
MWSSFGIERVGLKTIWWQKMQLLGCRMTRDILANIETRRSAVTDKRIMFFAEVFGVDVGFLFPPIFWRAKPTCHERGC